MDKPQTVNEVVDLVALPTQTEVEKAIALHDFVRDNVKFGFNKYFDAAPSDYTLAFGYGHCNPKSRLMVELFRAAGFEAHQHFVVIPKTILNGVLPASRMWTLPRELCHSYAEVQVEGRWCAIDSYIVDTPLLKGGLAKLGQEGRPLGYGVRSDSVNIWGGQSDAFSQFDRSMMIEDHGRIQDLEAYFQDKRYRHKMLGMRFNTMFQWMGENGMRPMNAHIETLRL